MSRAPPSIAKYPKWHRTKSTSSPISIWLSFYSKQQLPDWQYPVRHFQSPSTPDDTGQRACHLPSALGCHLTANISYLTDNVRGATFHRQVSQMTQDKEHIISHQHSAVILQQTSVTWLTMSGAPPSIAKYPKWHRTKSTSSPISTRLSFIRTNDWWIMS